MIYIMPTRLRLPAKIGWAEKGLTVRNELAYYADTLIVETSRLHKEYSNRSFQ